MGTSDGSKELQKGTREYASGRNGFLVAYTYVREGKKKGPSIKNVKKHYTEKEEAGKC
jgi:hypothetical protein